MRTLGVDLAAATRKTAAAVIVWGSGTARLEHLALDVGDEEIVRLFGASDMTGIDCPVGWPDALLPFLAGHLAFQPHPVLDYDGIEGRRLLAYRDTDRFVTARTGLIPLSVSADRLAHPGDALRRHPSQNRSGSRTAGQGRRRPARGGVSGGDAEVLGSAGPRLQGARRRRGAAAGRDPGRPDGGCAVA